MKEEALKLANELDALHQYVPSEAPDMIRRLVEELSCANDYIKQYQLEIKNHKYDPETGEPLIDGYPLFSGLPRQKPLSDEELDKEASTKMNQIMMDLIDSEDWNKGCTKQHLVNFARAIEERHGIK